MTNTIIILTAIMKIIGSVGLFLYGMKVLSDGLQKAAGEKLQKILDMMTTNRFAAIFTGFFVTGIIQSSSATTVMVVSFANAGLMNLTQSIGVIMGANIGTTVTGWIVSLLGFKSNIQMIALVCIGIGLPMTFFKKGKTSEIGESIVGFGILFLGLDFLNMSLPQANASSLDFLQNISGFGYGSILLFFMAGMMLTFVVQSSSAVMAVVLSIAFKGWIDFPLAAAIILGSNIGTTITAILASIGTTTNAKRAALAHFMFNLLGSVWVLVIFYPYISLVEHITDFITPNGLPPAVLITFQLSVFHTLFNTINTFAIFVWIINPFAKLIEWMMPDKKKQEGYSLKYIGTNFQNTPEMNIRNAKHEIIKMFELSQSMFERAKGSLEHPEEDISTKLILQKKDEELSDKMQEEISSYLAHCAMENLSDTSRLNVDAFTRIVQTMEDLCDSCLDLSMLSQRRSEKKLELDPAAAAEIRPFYEKVTAFMDFIKTHLNEHLHTADMHLAWELENEIDQMRDELKESARRRMQKGGNIKGELLYIDVIKHIEHIGDYSFQIAKQLKAIK